MAVSKKAVMQQAGVLTIPEAAVSLRLSQAKRVSTAQMEVSTEPHTNPLFEMHRQLTDAQKGLITFRMLTKALVELAKLYPEPSEQKERGGCHLT
jgi:hypothetical protein